MRTYARTRRGPPHQTAAAIACESVFRFDVADTAERALAALQEPQHRDATMAYVTDHGRLVGVVPISKLITAKPDVRLGLLATSPLTTAPAEMDQEHLAALAAEHDISEVAVVDEHGRLIGVVPAHTIIRVVRHEHMEDMHKLVGIIHKTNYAAHALEFSPWRRVRDRLPWLMVGLIGSAIAASIMSLYEAALVRNIAVAFFVPTIVYLADAIGTQTEAVAVRGLSLTHVPLGAILARELMAGLLIGLILGGLAAPIVALWFDDLRLAIAVSASIVAAGGAATTIGLLLPWTLSRFGADPAFGSGPVATVIQDVLSLLVYFSLVALIV